MEMSVNKHAELVTMAAFVMTKLGLASVPLVLLEINVKKVTIVADRIMRTRKQSGVRHIFKVCNLSGRARAQ